MVDPHVVGDDIQEQAQVTMPKSANEFTEASFAAQIGVEAVEIADVITVGALRPGAGDGGEVEVTDAEIGEVAQQRPRVTEGELGVELDAIGGARNGADQRM